MLQWGAWGWSDWIGALGLCGSIAAAAPAATVEHPADQTIIVYGRADDLLGIAVAASEGHVGSADFSTRPLQRVGELLEVVPGLIATQHSGTGKANQYFLRGFNLDHGTDFAGFLDGVPLNYRSHGHGQGYLDLNFMIPETIAAIDYRKGPYRADVGDFATAGAGLFSTYDSVPAPLISVEAGRGDYYRAVALGSQALGSGTLLIAGEGALDRGRYAIDEKARKGVLFAKYVAPLGGGTLRATASAYHVRFNSAEQIPQRAVASGLIGRLGSLDPDLGGRTTRLGATIGWDQDGAAPLSLFGYAHLYRFKLVSNFTYFLDDPVNGDEFAQRDRRSVIGGRISKRAPLTIAGVPIELSIGAETRFDFIPLVGLYRTVGGRVISTVRQDDVTEGSGAVYVEAIARPTPNLRIMLGGRGDLYSFKVRSDLAANSGTSHQGIVTPKLSVAWQPARWAELYANYGQGFHSNDARGTSINIDPVSGGAASPVDPLVRATGEELGLRLRPAPRLNLTVTAWRLRLGSELLFLGDGGTTEPQGPSRRRGIEIASFYQPVRWLTLDADYSRSRGRLTDLPAGADFIPGALEEVLSAGAVVDVGDVTASIRVRHFGSVALVEDDSVRSRATTIVNGRVAYRFGRYEIAANLLNMLNSKDAEINYFYASRLPGEPADGIDDVHSKAVEPRQLRVAGTMRF